MIVQQKMSWWRQITMIRGTSLQRTWPRLLGVTAVAFVVAELHVAGGWSLGGLTTIPFTLVGVALGIFLGFRNNTSYDRYWEGRKLWGQLVNTTRSLTRQILTLVGHEPHDPSDDDTDDSHLPALRRELVYRLIAYVHVLRHHLRDEDELVDAKGLLDGAECEALREHVNRPNAVLQTLGERFTAAWRAGLVDTYHLAILEGSLTELTNIQGGCERIKSTPIPVSYTVLIHRIVATYVFALPFGIVDQVGLVTPVVIFMIAYAFFGLDAIGDEIENPFGMDPNDLPLSALSRMIEVNLRQQLGEREVPSLMRPVDDVLV